MRRLVREIEPDVLHLQNGAFPNYLGLFTGFRPLCFTGWNGDILWRSNPELLQEICVRLILRRADVVTANSTRMWERCIAMGASPDRMRRVQWGPDRHTFYRRDASRLRRSLQIENRPVVLSSRSIDFQTYNLDVIVRAIPHVLAQVPDACFVFVWHSGTDLPKMRELLRVLRVESAAILIGTVEPNSMPWYYSLADLFVSLVSEDSCPRSMLEAMACGVAPVMGDTPDAREWIRDGFNGHLVPGRDPQAVANAVACLLRSRETRDLFATRNVAWLDTQPDFECEMVEMERSYAALATRYVKRRGG